MRLAGRMKSGFYPLADGCVAEIAECLQVQPGATIFDPCCGKGTAVLAIADAVGIDRSRVYACEMDSGRHADAKEQFGERCFGPLDFLSSNVTGNPSIVYLNPPFDDELGGGGRIELRFIQKAAWLMKEGAVLVLILPGHVAEHENTLKVLRPYSESLTKCKFKTKVPFDETLIIGVRRKGEEASDVTYQDRYNFRMLNQRQEYRVRGGGAVSVTKRGYTEQEIVEIGDQSPANAVLEMTDERASKSIRPPMALTRGHMAMLLASGMLDGVVHPEGEESHVVRGSCRKVVVEEVEKTGGGVKVKRTDQIQLTVKVADSSGVKVLEEKVENEVKEEKEDTDEDAS